MGWSILVPAGPPSHPSPSVAPGTEPAPGAPWRGGSCQVPGAVLLVGLAWVTHRGHRKMGTWAGGCGDGGNPSLQRSSAPGRAVPGQRGGCHPQHPRHGCGSPCCRGRCWAQTRMSSGAEPVVICVSLCLSVRLCTCECVCLCAQPGKVAVRERCQQPRKGLGMESVSQIGTQGQPKLLQPLCGHGFHLRHGRSGSTRDESSRCWARCLCQGIWAEQEPRGAWRSR